MEVDHFFDFAGLKFVAKLLLACAFVGAAGDVGFYYLLTAQSAPLSSTPPSIAVGRDSLLVSTTSPLISSSATVPERVIDVLTPADVVPQTGKFVVADLKDMLLTLYQDGVVIATYPILTKGKPGSPYETPAGFYSVLTKEHDHFNAREQVHMPYSMQFYGNYFIHGWPYYPDGTQVASTYSGGCIRLSTSDAGKVFSFANKGTGIFVYDPARATSPASIAFNKLQIPPVSATSYLVADIDTGDVYLEQNATNPRPIASLTKLMTALVANETIMFNNQIAITRAELLHSETASTKKETFFVDDLLYPLLMEENNAIADRLAQYYGTTSFVDWMNTTAKALDMQSTHFADASGISSENVSTTDDLYRLARYLANKKLFIWNITRTPGKDLIASSGDIYHFNNFNIYSDNSDFIGGKVGQTVAAQNTMVSVFSLPVNGEPRRIAIVVLKSDDYTTDTTRLVDWFTQSAERGMESSGTACASCATIPNYRKIR